MMKQLGFLVLGATTLGCSGSYYEVGNMDGEGGAGGIRGAAGGAAPGGSPSSTAGMANPGAGTGTAGPATPAGEPCGPSGAPPRLTGAFAEPAVVWDRISLLTYGAPTPAPTALPATTTYAWAGAAVQTALDDARLTLGTAPGAEAFLRQALELEASAPFRQSWGVLLSTDNSVLNALLRAPLDEPGRVGIFSEPSWLAIHTTISARGAGIEQVLFARAVPTPPANLESPPPDPELPDRANLEVALSSSAACVGCHAIMDPAGFTLGHFAADGTYRKLDHGLPIDTSGSRFAVEFDGVADFGEKFETDCGALQGIATSFLRAAIVINAPLEGVQWELGSETNVARVQQAFVNSDRTYEALVRAYILSPAGLRP